MRVVFFFITTRESFSLVMTTWASQLQIIMKTPTGLSGSPVSVFGHFLSFQIEQNKCLIQKMMQK